MKYPNLESLEHQMDLALSKNTEFLKKLQLIDKSKCEIEVTVFPQLWGNTCTGFDITENGKSIISQSIITKEYTSVFHELLTNTWCIFFGNKLCYIITDPNEKFYKDLSEKHMASLSEAKQKY